ncbi:MAG: hypothetical protein ACRCW9_06240 [Cetobacterium sp.]
MDKEGLIHLARIISYEVNTFKDLVEYMKLNVTTSEKEDFVNLLKKYTFITESELKKINSLKINDFKLEKYNVNESNKEFIEVVYKAIKDFKIFIYRIDPTIRFKLDSEEIMIELSDGKINILFSSSIKKNSKLINKIFNNDLNIVDFREKFNKRNILAIKLGGTIE